MPLNDPAAAMRNPVDTEVAAVTHSLVLSPSPHTVVAAVDTPSTHPPPRTAESKATVSKAMAHQAVGATRAISPATVEECLEAKVLSKVARRDHQDHQAHLDHPASQEAQDNPDSPELQLKHSNALKRKRDAKHAQEARQAHRVLQEAQDPLAHQDSQEHQVRAVVADSQAHLAHQEMPDPMEHQEMLDHPVNQELQEQAVPLSPAHQDHLAHQANQAHQEIQADQPDQDNLDHQDQLALQVNQVSPEAQDSLALMDNLASLDMTVNTAHALHEVVVLFPQLLAVTVPLKDLAITPLALVRRLQLLRMQEVPPQEDTADEWQPQNVLLQRDSSLSRGLELLRNLHELLWIDRKSVV